LSYVLLCAILLGRITGHARLMARRVIRLFAFKPGSDGVNGRIAVGSSHSKRRIVMSKIMEPVLQFFALGIFAVVMLFSLPFMFVSMFFVNGDETRVATQQGFSLRLLQSEALWGCIALVAWVSFVTVLKRG
jgi:hypothetical protein